ncbi:MAG: hypothetical protein M5U34_11985 [Chloroflexi bacterium]|nr:hypothetical protein [Chloroflexota bacterium]
MLSVQWKLLFPTSTDFKQFRKSSDFQPIAQDIAANMKRVLQHTTPIASGFELLALDDLLNTYAAGNSDFNDQVLAALCQTAGLTLVTDDADFRGQGIPIITNNRNLLTRI